jgi:hypothetical protein
MVPACIAPYEYASFFLVHSSSSTRATLPLWWLRSQDVRGASVIGEVLRRMVVGRSTVRCPRCDGDTSLEDAETTVTKVSQTVVPDTIAYRASATI